MGKVQDLRKYLNTQFLERSELIDISLTAVLCKEHVLQIGPPGSTKSKLARTICQAFSDANYFDWSMSKFSVPEELFGPLSLKGLEQDRYARNVTGKAPDAHIIHLDEIGKSNAAIRGALLPLMNERIFHNDGKPLFSPLITLFGSTNEIPQDEESQGFLDRFVFWYQVEYVKEDCSAEALIRGIPEAKLPVFTLADLHAEQLLVQKVKLPDAIVKVMVKLRKEIDNEGILVSDRKWSQMGNALKAYAYLNGNTEVLDTDLMLLSHIMWKSTDQQSKVRRLVAKTTNPLGDKILQYVDAMVELQKSVKAEKVDPIETFKKVKHAISELQKMGDPTKIPALDRAIKQIKGIQADIAQNYLGLEG